MLFDTSILLTADYEPNLFFTWQRGYILALKPLQAGTRVALGKQFLNSIMSGKFVMVDNTIVGYYFTSALKIINGGAYLCAYLQAKAGQAKECNRIVNSDTLVLLDYPGCGVIAISPVVSNRIRTVFEEQ